MYIESNWYEIEDADLMRILVVDDESQLSEAPL